MKRGLMTLLMLLAGSMALQAQEFAVQEAHCRLHCRVTDAVQREAEALRLEMTDSGMLDFVFPEWVTFRGVRYALVSARSGLMKNNLQLRSLATGRNLRSVGSQLCYGCDNLKQLTIGTGLQSFGPRSFALCSNLETVYFNAIDCYTKKDQGYWMGCHNLRTLHIGDSVQRLGDGIFAHCSSLDCELHLPEGLRHIGHAAFDDCSNIKGKLVLPMSLEAIGKMAFAGMNNVDTLVLRSRLLEILPGGICQVFYHSINPVAVMVDSTVIELPALLFSNFKGMKSCQLPDDMEILDVNTFEVTLGLREIRLPSQLRYIGGACFYQSGLDQLVLPDKVEMVDNYAFAYCYNLKEATIGKNVRLLGDYCFVEDTALRRLTVLAEVPPRAFEHTFSEMDLDRITLVVPESSLEAYRKDPIWGRFTVIKS